MWQGFDERPARVQIDIQKAIAMAISFSIAIATAIAIVALGVAVGRSTARTGTVCGSQVICDDRSGTFITIFTASAASSASGDMSHAASSGPTVLETGQ